jgi:hypothetical protein
MNFVRWLAPGRCHVVEPPDSAGWLTARLHYESVDLAKMLVFGLGAHPPDGRFHFLGVDVVRAGFQLSTSASMR